MPRASIKYKRVYGFITPEIVETICHRRLLAADLLSRADNREVSHAAKMVRDTVETIRQELMELID